MEECTTATKDPKIVLEEKGKKMTFLNKRRTVVRKIQVDDCAVKEGIRCDWLVINDEDYEHFVELKGNDVVHACNQLSASITQLSENAEQDAKHSFVIPTKVAPAITTKIQNLKKIFKKKFNCTLIVKNTECTFEL